MLNIKIKDDSENCKDYTVGFNISENDLESLIDGLKRVHSKISQDDRLDITINFNKGIIKTYVQPRGDYNFETIF